MSMAARLKALRLERGWSQRELAKRAGVRQALISELENGREDCAFHNLRRIARAFWISLDYLVGTFDEDNDV